MLPYLTDYENDRRLFRPRMVNAILVLLPFMVLYRATELWFSDMYWFDYMKQGHYGLMWAGLCLLSVRKPRFALVAAYGDAAAIVIASFTGDALWEYNKLTATPENYIKSCEGRLAHHAPWIWIQPASSRIFSFLLTSCPMDMDTALLCRNGPLCGLCAADRAEN